MDWDDSNRIGHPARDIEVKVYRYAMASELQGRFEALIGKRLTIRLHDPQGGLGGVDRLGLEVRVEPAAGQGG